MFEEIGSNSWRGIRVRKSGREGVVTSDFNGYYRELVIKMDDGKHEKILMNNFGDDPKETQEWEFFSTHGNEERWLSF